MRRADAALAFCASIASLSALTACRSPERYADADHLYWAGEPRGLFEAYAGAETDRHADGLVGRMKLLSAALCLRDWEDARRRALEVSTEVNVYLAGERGERDALSPFGREQDKPFKGEPHEQAMADFYLGLLRYAENDFEGALSCFRSAIQKDRGSYLLPVEVEDATDRGSNTRRYLYDADYATFEVFAARCWRALGEEDAAREALSRARAVRPELAGLCGRAADPETNVLVLIEAGRAPRKRRSGPRGAVLDYDRGPAPQVEKVLLDGREIPFGVTDDLYFQATTLGGRRVDELNLEKARLQEALGAVGKAGTVAGIFVAASGDHRRNRKQRDIGLAMMAAGLLTQLFSEAAFEAGADTRGWTLLPSTLILGVGKAPPGESHRLEITWRGAGGRRTRSWEDIPLRQDHNLVLVRLASPAVSTAGVPGADREVRRGPPRPDHASRDRLLSGHREVEVNPR